MINSWFTVEKIDKDTWIISDYCHPEETHCCLIDKYYII